jgi:single-strand DNA-binding protein
MSQGGYVTLIGFVAREPNLRMTKDKRPVADVRVGATNRYLDKTTNEWRDGDTSYFTVTCWRRLADHAKASLRKGDPVMVKGRFRTRTYEDKQSRIRVEVEIVADTIGHDLSRGTANYLRPSRSQTENADTDDLADGDPAGGDVDARYPQVCEGGSPGYPDDPGPAGSMAGYGAPPLGGPGLGDPGSGQQIDEEEAVNQLNRDLDRELAEDGQLAGGGPAMRDPAEASLGEPEEPAGAPLPY